MAKRLMSLSAGLAVMTLVFFLEYSATQGAPLTGGMLRNATGLLEIAEGADGEGVLWEPLGTVTHIAAPLALRTGNEAHAELSVQDALISLGAETVWQLVSAEKEVTMLVSQGSALVNAQSSDAPVQLQSGEVILHIEGGSAAMEHKENLLMVYALSGGVSVQLYADSPPTPPLFFLPEGELAVFDRGQLKERKDDIMGLSYPELVAEFVRGTQAAPAWISGFSKSVEGFHAEIQQQFLDELRTKRRSFAVSAPMRTVWRPFSSFLTFDEVHRANRLTNQARTDIDHWLALLLLGENDTADAFLSSLVIPVEARQEMHALLKNRLSALNSFPNDHVLRTKAARPLLQTLSQVSTKPEERIASLEYLRIMLKTAQENLRAATVLFVQETETLLQAYADLFRTVTQGLTAENAVRGELLAHRSLLLSLFDEAPLLLDEDTLAVLSLIERTYMQNLDPAEVLPMRKYFLAQRIVLLKRLQELAFAEQKPLPQIRFASRKLIYDITALKPLGVEEVPGDEYFDAEVKKLQPFLDFLESPFATLHGTVDERYFAFAEKTSEADQLSDLVGGRGQVPKVQQSKKTIAEILEQDLGSIGVTSLRFEEPTAATDVVLIAEMQLAGISFGGRYDFKRKNFTELTLLGEHISQTIPLERLPRFVMIRTGQLRPNDVSLETTTQDTVSQTESNLPKDRVDALSRTKLRERFIFFGIETTLEDIRLVDGEAGLFFVGNASITDASSTVVFSFHFVQSNERASQVRIDIGQEETMLVNGTFALSELPGRVRSLYRRALENDP